MLTYIKKLAIYMFDIGAAFLGFARDVEASALLLVKYLERICIRTESDRGRLCQDEDMEQEHGEVWGSIHNSVELV